MRHSVHLFLFLIVGLSLSQEASAQGVRRVCTPSSPCPTLAEIDARRAVEDSLRAVEREDSRRRIQALDAARAERVRLYLDQHPDALKWAASMGVVLEDVTPWGEPLYIGNLAGDASLPPPP
ncbi:MAG TPA: hypothetical protein VGB53_02525 [Rubricoccaceae bacterium]|jgi:hypothetical protein